MNHAQTSIRFDAATITIHWLMVLLLVLAYASMEFKGIFPKGSDARTAMATLHYAMGISVLALAILRLLINLPKKLPIIVPTPPVWQQRIARLMHYALYIWMCALPLLGWFLISAKGTNVAILGLHLPSLIGADKQLAHLLKELHESLATIGYFLIGLHACAALFHHYFIRDNTLLRMLPKYFIKK